MVKPSNRPVNWVLIVLAIFSVGCLGSGVAIFLFGSRFFEERSAVGELNGAVKAYRDAGLPWEAKDIAAKPAVDAAENAAPILRRAIKQFDSARFKKERPEFKQLSEAQNFGELNRRLAVYAPAFDVAADTMAKSGLDFGRDWDLGTEVLFPEYASIKEMIQALSLRAQAKAFGGNAVGATQDLRIARHLAELVGKEPSLIALLVRVAGERIVYDAVQRCAALLRSNPSELRQLETVLGEPGVPAYLGGALRGEAFLGVTTIRNLALMGARVTGKQEGEEPPPIDPRRLRRTGLPTSRRGQAYMTRHCQIWTEVQREIQRYPKDSVALGRAVTKIEEAWSRRRGPSYTMNAIMFPVVLQAGFAVGAMDTERTVTRALLKALAIHAATGRYPSRIEDLPGAWTDPFSQKPLRLHLTGDSIRIYSVGPDGLDNGGIHRSELKGSNKTTGWDVVASFPPRKISN